MTSFCASFPEAAALEATYLRVLGTSRFRTLQELQGFFGDLEMIEPGLVSLPEWRSLGGGSRASMSAVCHFGVSVDGRVP
jgi:hypothetical protein